MRCLFLNAKATNVSIVKVAKIILIVIEVIEPLDIHLLKDSGHLLSQSRVIEFLIDALEAINRFLIMFPRR